ncbi:MAG: ABC transporter permease [Actinomycetota bacterium]|nr:ABC transporter permease [Actinomycetota bacterium]
MSAARAAFVIARKDLRQRARDGSVFLFAFAAPLGMAVIFSLALGSGSDGISFELGIANDDPGGAAAEQFVAVTDEIDGSGQISVVRYDDRDAVVAAVDDGDVGAAWIVPAGFSESVDAARAGPGDSTDDGIAVVGSADAAISTSVARSVAEGFLAQRRAVTLAIATVASLGGGAPEDPAGLAEAALALDAPYVLEDGEESAAGLELATYYSASLSVFFLFFTVPFALLGVMEERDQGTLARLRVAPVPTRAVIGGKLLGAFVTGIVSMTALVVATTVLLDAEWGAPLGVAILIVVGVTAAMAVAAAVGTLVRTAEQASAAASIVAVVLGLLGGAFFPISSGSPVLEVLSRISPHRWMLDGFRELSFGEPVSAIWPAVLAVGGFSLVLGLVAAVRADRWVEA